jgi:hypothetical protein
LRKQLFRRSNTIRTGAPIATSGDRIGNPGDDFAIVPGFWMTPGHFSRHGIKEGAGADERGLMLAADAKDLRLLRGLPAMPASRLSAFAVYVLKLLPAAADHRAVEFPLSFSVKALPIGALYPNGKRLVRPLKNAIDVKVLITRLIGMIRTEASSQQKACDKAKLACNIPAVPSVFSSHRMMPQRRRPAPASPS